MKYWVVQRKLTNSFSERNARAIFGAMIANLIVAMNVCLFYFEWFPLIVNAKKTWAQQLLWLYVCSPNFLMFYILVEALYKMPKVSQDFSLSKRQVLLQISVNALFTFTTPIS